MHKLITLSAITLCLSGCAHINSRAISYEGAPDKNSSRLFVWNSEYSAGVGINQRMCVESARVAKENNTKGEVDGVEQVTVEVSNDQDVVILNPGNAQTTFSSGAYFALCQISMNRDDITPAQIAEMFNGITEAAEKISIANGTTAAPKTVAGGEVTP